MSQVVQAKCPHCQTVLRIPSEWVAKPMRCKHCKQTFQAKAHKAASTNVTAAVPVAQPAKPSGVLVGLPAKGGAPPASNTPFGFDTDEPQPQASSSPAPRRRGRGAGMLLLVAMFFLLFVIGVSGAGFVIYKAFYDPATRDNNQASKNDGTKTAFVPDPKKPGSDNNPGTDGPKKPDDKDKVIDPVTPGVDPPKKKPKKELPKKELPKEIIKEKDKEKKNPPAFANDGPFPRRALLISATNYLYFDPIHYGSDVKSVSIDYPGSSTGVLRDRLMGPPMYFPPMQIVELSDGTPSTKTTRPHPTHKSVLEAAITDFVDSAREQDRIVILFAGHAAFVEDKSYLVPPEASLKKTEKLIELAWVYKQLAGCKAQQKILILDVFRFSPSRGIELASTGEGEEGTMPEGFDKDLLNPPAGVQVWSSCQMEVNKEKEKVGQSSIELEAGSAFMQALSHSLKGGGDMKGIADASQPIPIEALVDAVNKRLADLVAPTKKTQVSRLTGKASGAMVAYNRDEPLATPITLKPPVVEGGGDLASVAQVESILDFFQGLPSVREARAADKALMDAKRLRGFTAKTLDGYKTDGYKDLAELKKRYTANKDAFAKDFPVRAAVLDALDAMQESDKIRMYEVQRSPITPQRKNDVKKEQDVLGESTFKLEQALSALKEAEKEMEMETSKRWHANYHYARARLQSRLIYILEYNFVLARVRQDEMPELAAGQDGWRIGTGKKITVNERKAKDLAKDTKKVWDKIVKNYPDTPWSLFAEREREITLGLQWRPKSN